MKRATPLSRGVAIPPIVAIVAVTAEVAREYALEKNAVKGLPGIEPDGDSAPGVPKGIARVAGVEVMVKLLTVRKVTN